MGFVGRGDAIVRRSDVGMDAGLGRVSLLLSRTTGVLGVCRGAGVCACFALPSVPVPFPAMGVRALRVDSGDGAEQRA